MMQSSNPSASRISNSNLKVSASKQKVHDLASAGFLPLRDEDEPLSDQQFAQLPGNLKKSYLMMEIQEDKLQ